MSARGVLGNAYLVFALKEMQSSACAAGKILAVGCVPLLLSAAFYFTFYMRAGSGTCAPGAAPRNARLAWSKMATHLFII